MRVILRLIARREVADILVARVETDILVKWDRVARRHCRRAACPLHRERIR